MGVCLAGDHIPSTGYIPCGIRYTRGDTPIIYMVYATGVFILFFSFVPRSSSIARVFAMLFLFFFFMTNQRFVNYRKIQTFIYLSCKTRVLLNNERGKKTEIKRVLHYVDTKSVVLSQYYIRITFSPVPRPPPPTTSKRTRFYYFVVYTT